MLNQHLFCMNFRIGTKSQSLSSSGKRLYTINRLHVTSRDVQDTHVTVVFSSWVLWRYVTLRYVTLRYVTLRYVTLRYVTLRYVTLRYVIRYVTLHYTYINVTLIEFQFLWWVVKFIKRVGVFVFFLSRLLKSFEAW